MNRGRYRQSRPDDSSRQSRQSNADSSISEHRYSGSRPSHMQAPRGARQQGRPRPATQVRQHQPPQPALFPDKDYEAIGDKIGEGTYGIVYKARNKTTNEVVAIKSFKPIKECEGVSSSAIHEAVLLKELKHDNIINLQAVHLDPSKLSLALVFDYAEYDLSEIIKQHACEKRKPLPLYCIKSMLFQLLSGLSYMHSTWMLHRDLKPSNILIAHTPSQFGKLKIADFGLARIFHAPLSSLDKNGLVVTMWYRAPELLFGTRHYTPAVDVWAAGCIFYELMALQVLFQGEEVRQQIHHGFQQDQMKKMFNILGVPNEQNWPELPHHNLFKSSTSQYREFRASMRSMPTESRLEQHVRDSSKLPVSPSALDLLKRMLTYNPKNRISAKAALDHQYFKEQPVPGNNVFSPEAGKMLLQYVKVGQGQSQGRAQQQAYHADHHQHHRGNRPADQTKRPKYSHNV